MTEKTFHDVSTATPSSTQTPNPLHQENRDIKLSRAFSGSIISPSEEDIFSSSAAFSDIFLSEKVVLLNEIALAMWNSYSEPEAAIQVAVMALVRLAQSASRVTHDTICSVLQDSRAHRIDTPELDSTQEVLVLALTPTFLQQELKRLGFGKRLQVEAPPQRVEPNYFLHFCHVGCKQLFRMIRFLTFGKRSSSTSKDGHASFPSIESPLPENPHSSAEHLATASTEENESSNSNSEVCDSDSTATSPSGQEEVGEDVPDPTIEPANSTSAQDDFIFPSVKLWQADANQRDGETTDATTQEVEPTATSILVPQKSLADVQDRKRMVSSLAIASQKLFEEAAVIPLNEATHSSSSPNSNAVIASSAPEKVEPSNSLAATYEFPDIIKRHFEIGEMIAQGGFGTIFAAVLIDDFDSDDEDEDEDEDAATVNEHHIIKCLKIQESDPECIAICEEIGIMKFLQTRASHQLGPSRCFATDDTIYVALKLGGIKWAPSNEIMKTPLSAYISSETLRIFDESKATNDLKAYLRLITSDHKMKLYLLAQLTCAFRSIHANGVVHGDIKAANVLVDSNLKIKIIDYGLSQSIIDGDLFDEVRDPKRSQKFLCPANILGTPGYIAPELYRLEPYDGEAADVFSLGSLFHLIRYGYMPFSNEYYLSMNEQRIIDEPLPALLFRKNENRLEGLIEGMLTKDPKDRWNMNQVKDFFIENEYFTKSDWEKIEKEEYTFPLLHLHFPAQRWK